MKGALDAATVKHGVDVTFSIGAVTFANAPDHSEQALALAHAAMYEVKNAGKDNISWRQI